MCLLCRFLVLGRSVELWCIIRWFGVLEMWLVKVMCCVCFGVMVIDEMMVLILCDSSVGMMLF